MIDPVVIAPEAVYDDTALKQALGLSPAALSSGRRSGKLRYARKGNRTLYRGAWVLHWLDSDAPHDNPGPCREGGGR
jgi:hypothetical protein